MDLLILGGTEFVGRALTEDALARGWKVTLFHRGNHAPVDGVDVLHGDRIAPGGLAALEQAVAAGRRFDAVVDTWSAAPAAVRATARLLADHVDRYAYVSSGSVYTFPQPAGANESAPVVDADPGATEAPYAQAKRGAELALLEVFGERALFGRAGLILGPHENIGRLPWWLGRIARGGTVLAPGPRELPLQYIDARDLAAWLLDAVAAGLGGAYNLVGPPGATTMGELLDTCLAVTGSAARLRWTDPEPILAAGIEPWTDLPIWLPPGEEHDTLHGVSVDKALAAGLRVRPVAETVADTWAWLQSVGGTAPQRPDRPPVGLAPERETDLLRTLAIDAPST
ncbi:NAD-dependent epimerase/dehydratase family protein [Streptacidiphilus jiangxiensis]|uniref:Nucleoside-diphosphate-sugar epimerase n=1 Tax=Streptacidiphilus jiangxiensis TaxID=235985 RepID=A0A1H7UA13_STRJI|nr:NAD-dependent epimerase/dehydratase family protein [Streptacidiphilus jiangxiensis]SEL93649.1 Nucleoside-diphosphate-sugar epimerase [Streptacidiphilus jiangxiensis]